MQFSSRVASASGSSPGEVELEAGAREPGEGVASSSPVQGAT